MLRPPVSRAATGEREEHLPLAADLFRVADALQRAATDPTYHKPPEKRAAFVGGFVGEVQPAQVQVALEHVLKQMLEHARQLRSGRDARGQEIQPLHIAENISQIVKTCKGFPFTTLCMWLLTDEAWMQVVKSLWQADEVAETLKAITRPARPVPTGPGRPAIAPAAAASQTAKPEESDRKMITRLYRLVDTFQQVAKDEKLRKDKAKLAVPPHIGGVTGEVTVERAAQAISDVAEAILERTHKLRMARLGEAAVDPAAIGAELTKLVDDCKKAEFTGLVQWLLSDKGMEMLISGLREVAEIGGSLKSGAVKIHAEETSAGPPSKPAPPPAAPPTQAPPAQPAPVVPETRGAQASRQQTPAPSPAAPKKAGCGSSAILALMLLAGLAWVIVQVLG